MQLLQHFKELTIRPKNAKELKGLILQLAIQGKLTANWRAENKDIEPASELLKRIQKEKEQLVKEKKIKKGNVFSELSYDDIPYTISEKWIWCKVGDITDIIAGASFKSGDFNKTGGVKCIKITNAGVRDFVETNDYLPEGFNELYTNYLIKEGDLILALTRPYIKDGLKISTCPPSYNNSLLNQRVASIRSMSSYVFHPYIFSFIQSPMVLKLYKSKFDGKSQQPNMKMGDIIDLVISLPPLEEQKEIVKVVETLFKEVEQLEQLTVARIGLKEDFLTSALNQLTTNNAKQEWTFLQEHFKSFFNETTNIKKLRETVLQLAVQGKLTADWRANNPDTEDASILLKRIQEGKAQLIKEKKIKNEKALPKITKDETPYELPEGWVWCRLIDISVYIQRGKSPKYSDIKKYPVIAQKCIQWKDFEMYKAKFIDPETIIKYGPERILKTGDLLWNSTGRGSLGRIGLYNELYNDYELAVADSHVTVIRVDKENCNADYAFKYLSSPFIQDHIESRSSGSTNQIELNTTTVKETMFPLAPLEEQKVIVEKVNALMGLCDALEQEVQQSQEHSEMMMQSVLREVFEGESKMVEV
ncbi:restriction endonuclease subunit S [Bizionia myxarmorum]|uniref:Type I restriction modification DNA specificity domain-containing protein n=1 Tax=Bizionia myxarmorum TaxID=291186 RepID=A0A5D0QZA6_9FLAO|nr:restriction endonuclease subunit S [Bizionia myxarmorum]TYB74055.1 hypothetical protein ES674_14995 [Bizionia myxarmorum]